MESHELQIPHPCRVLDQKGKRGVINTPKRRG